MTSRVAVMLVALRNYTPSVVKPHLAYFGKKLGGLLSPPPSYFVDEKSDQLKSDQLKEGNSFVSPTDSITINPGSPYEGLPSLNREEDAVQSLPHRDVWDNYDWDNHLSGLSPAERIVAAKLSVNAAAEQVRQRLQRLSFDSLPDSLKNEALQEKMQRWPSRLNALNQSLLQNLTVSLVDDQSTDPIESTKRLTTEIKKLQAFTAEIIDTHRLIKAQPEFAQKGLLANTISMTLTCIGAIFGLLAYFIPLVSPFTALLGPMLSLTSGIGGFAFQKHNLRNKEYLEAWQNLIDSINELKTVTVGEESMLVSAVKNLTQSVQANTKEVREEIEQQRKEIDDLKLLLNQIISEKKPSHLSQPFILREAEQQASSIQETRPKILPDSA
jgi:hypothetical protein